MTEYTKAKKPSIVVGEKWVDEWPTQKGYYWFYGNRSEFDKGKAKLCFVEVRGAVNNVYYVTEGQFLFRSEGAEGKWLKAKLPVSPN